MGSLLYVLGFIIGLAFFLYLLSLYYEGKSKISGALKSRRQPDNGQEMMNPADKRINRVDSEKLELPGLENIPPGVRLCPLCRRSLSKYEPLYASQVQTEKGSRIIIYGCNHCYKSDGE